MKNQADRKRADRHFEVGEWVFLKLRPHGQLTLGARINHKLAPCYYGTYKVLARVGAVAYRQQLPATTKINPVFHILMLKKAVGDNNVEETLPSELASDDTVSVEPEAMQARRVIQKGGEMVGQVLIHWKVQGMEEATWEEEFNIRSQLPQLRLEDKSPLEEVGIDGNVGPDVETRPKIWRVYERRNRGVKRGEVARHH